jgi:hypothetical protein
MASSILDEHMPAYTGVKMPISSDMTIFLIG